MYRTFRNSNIAVNIAADGLETAVIQNTVSDIDVYKENTRKYISAFLENTPVGKMLFNVCYKRSVVDSDAIDSMMYNISRNEDGTPKRDENGNVIKTVAPLPSSSNLLRNYRDMIERKIDIIEMAVDEVHKYGAKAWLSVRMNDHHFPDDPGFNSSFSYDNAEKFGISGSRQSLDYSNKAVQSYYMEYIKELCEKYDIDGIELDFLRSCPIMSVTNKENTDLLTQYVAKLKETAKTAAGKEIELSARVYPEESMNLEYGIDAAQWIAEGSVNTLVAEGWYIPTYYNIPVSDWRNSINEKNTAKRPYSLLLGTDWAVRCHSDNTAGYKMWITLEQFKGFVSAAYNNGADGIYIFNHFEPDSDRGAYTYYIDKNGNKTCKNIFHDKLIAANSKNDAEKGMRTYVHTCRDYHNTLYPICVSESKPFSFSINTGTKPESGYYKIIIGLDKNECCEENLLAVTVNGTSTTQIEDVPKETGFVWSESDSFEPTASHVSEVAYRVIQFEADNLAGLHNGFNTVCITCKSKSQSIKWLEIQVEN